MAEFCKCGSMVIRGECSNVKCPDKDAVSLEWIIDGVSLKFKTPVTRTEAVIQSNGRPEAIRKQIEVNRQKVEDAHALADKRTDRIEKTRRRKGWR